MTDTKTNKTLEIRIKTFLGRNGLLKQTYKHLNNNKCAHFKEQSRAKKKTQRKSISM
jgi:hypothetical protein